ncbi:ABC transporter ATP-binding protein [Mycolicibacterium sp. GCM10028919]|uniref:ABC transporter ATP-binding protein n=1 Tax=Mycolicibacterium sp. GCM10028919 TaxID=3273401 RepID=UPI00361F7118
MATTLTARVRRHLLDVDLTLDLDAGSPVTVLFGPSGAGKTTLLRCLAGLDRPDPPSRISLGDHIWDDDHTHVPARRRRIGYLFQDHALFPHLGVAANVGYGLHHLPRRDRAARIEEALHTAGAAHLTGRPTRTLSGGEAQRVALARALAPHPQLLLFDEPLSALDAPTRAQLRTDLRRRLLDAAVPALVVTHDRNEALALGDRMAVLVDGALHQLAPVTEVFSRPADATVASTVGVETVVLGNITDRDGDLTRVSVDGVPLLAATAESLDGATRVLVCIRAEGVAIFANPEPQASPRNQLLATITALTPEGPLLRVDLDAGFPLAAYITHPTREDLDLRTGSRVTAAIKAPAVHLVPHA